MKKKVLKESILKYFLIYSLQYNHMVGINYITNEDY